MSWQDFVDAEPEAGSKDPIIQLTPRGEPGFQSRYPLLRRSEIGAPGRSMRLSEYMREWATHPADAIEGLQNRLVGAGLLKKGSFLLGRWDADTKDALLTVIAESIDQERDLETSLADRIVRFAEFGKSETSFVAPDRAKPDPATIRQNVRQLYSAEFGRAPGAKELEKYTRLLQRWDEQNYQMQTSASRAEFEAEQQGREISVTTEPIDVAARLQEQVRAEPEAVAKRADDAFNIFRRMVGAG